MDTLVAAVVGIDGSGKSSAFRGTLESLAQELDVVGIGDVCLSGAPGIPIHVRSDRLAHRLSRTIAHTARRTRHAWTYRQLKALDLIWRSRLREQVVREERPTVLLTDGDPLVNTLAWSVARLYREQLSGDDRRVMATLRYLSGETHIPRTELGTYLRHAPQLVLLDRLRLARFAVPDLVVLLELDGASAMQRIRGRGRARQVHETVAALDALGAGYDHICRLVRSELGVVVVRIAAQRTSQVETIRLVADAVRALLPEQPHPDRGDPGAPPIEVVATTISGSLQDQRKIGHILPRFMAHTRRPVRLHAVDSHAEAEAVTRDIVAAGGRIIVSAGGSGTFNAVLEGCHLQGAVPADTRLAFLRKGSADLIGKVLRIPDRLPAAAAAIVDGIEQDRSLTADVIAVETVGPEGEREIRHMVGFGGLGVFGLVPRFTEARWVKYYKGVIGSLVGDYGPFYVGLALATAWWLWLRARGRIPRLTLELDGQTVGPDRWSTIIVVGGDLGPDFPPGRGASFSSGSFRVLALRDRGVRAAFRQLAATRNGSVFADPDRHACLVRDARSLVVRASRQSRGQVAPALVNVDGLSRRSHGPVRFSLSGQVRLVVGP